MGVDPMGRPLFRLSARCQRSLGGVWFPHEVGEGLAVKKGARDLAEVAPYADGGAGVDPRAEVVVGAREALHGCEVSLGGTEQLADPVLLGLARETVAATLATLALDEARLVHERDDLLEVLARDALTP